MWRGWVEEDFRGYLRCGILAHGFARVRCADCAAERFLAFSCKARGVCVGVPWSSRRVICSRFRDDPGTAVPRTRPDHPRLPMMPRALAIVAVTTAVAAVPGLAQEGHPHDHAVGSLSGPVVSGHPAPDVETVRWVGDVENLTYSNPFGQEIGPVWYDGKLGYAIHGGQVWIDPDRTKWANQYMPVYSVDGGPDGGPERVGGQHIIYDTAPGDEGYSPIWRHHWVIVPRDYESNSLRSLADIQESDYRLITTDNYFN